jgi:hypothetical protein
MNDERIDSYIWNLHQQNLFQQKIAGILNVGRERIRAVIKAYVNNTKLIHQMGPSRKITPEIKSKLVISHLIKALYQTPTSQQS